MIGKLFIDGIDAFTAYGVYVNGLGYNDVLSWPSLKVPDIISWAEHNGEQVDLAAPVLAGREFNLPLAVSGSKINIAALIATLSIGSYHTFTFANIGRTFKLRFVSQQSMITTANLSLITLRFANDFPLRNYTYVSPVRTIVANDAYKIDARPLSDYNVAVLRGAEAEVLKTPPVKKKLSRDIKTAAGIIYDDDATGQVKYEAKDVRIECLMRANNLSILWQNYDALIYDLARPNAHTFFAQSTNTNYSCYYKDCSVTEFLPTDNPWLKFTFTLRFI